MTSRNKAKQIINQFQSELMYSTERAIYAALLTVDIILTEASNNPAINWEYWNQVHNELKTLLNN